MGVNQVYYNGRSLIDLTQDTVSADKLIAGYTAHNQSGEQIVGTLEVPKYIPLSYIESSGTEYIDTGFVANQDTRVDIVYQCSTTSGATIFGADSGWLTNAYAVFTQVAEYGSTSIAGSFYGSSQITLSMNKNTITKNGSTVGSGTYTTFKTESNLAIFALKRYGEAREFATMKLYSCQIYDNGTLVRDFVPAINLTGEVGLYDVANDKFYGNAGTGAFIGATG